MMSHLRTLIFSLVVLLYSGWVSALGLGDLILNSSLNEPFDAEVAILNTGELDVEQLYAKLASGEDFELVGVDRELYLLDLRFKLDTNKAGKPVIRITSAKPVREPYLDFLVQLQWPSGRLLRGYTVFLDLPVFAGKQSFLNSGIAQADNPVSGGAAKKKTTSAPDQSETSTSSVAGGASSQTGSYRVQSGDTLWGIAARNRPQGSSVQQVMQAIYERNSGAFVNGNMNVLKKGAVLDLPDASAISAVDDRQAKHQVALSAEQLQSQLASRELLSSEPIESVAPEKTTQSDGVLRLLSTGAGADSGSGGAADSPSEGLSREVLENDLAIAQEGLSKSSRENEELREKIAQLEEQLSTMSRLVELGDDQLSAIQQGLGEDASAAQGDDPSASAVEEPDDVVASAGPVAASEETQPDGLFAGLRNKLSVIAAGLLVVVLGALFLLSRRRKDEVAHTAAEKPFSFADRKSGLDRRESDLDLVARADDIDQDDQLSASDIDSDFASDDDGAAEGEHGEVDPIGEADIYLSFGDYGQAEAVIERALKIRPDDSRLHLKLLDLFAAQEDIDRFDSHYSQLVALGDPSAIQRADRIRGAITTRIDDLDEQSLSSQEVGLYDDDYLPESFDEDEDILDNDPEYGDLPLPVPVLDDDDDDSELDEDDADLDLDIELSESDEVEAELEVESEQELDLDYQQLELGDIELDLDSDDELEVGQRHESLESKSEFDDFDIDSDLDLLVEGDEIATQLELAQAYIDMGDKDGAKDILGEVLANGNAEQQSQAQEVLKQIA